MIHKNIKIALALASLGYAVYQFILGNIGNGIFLTLLAGVFILFYFKNEIILLAMFKMRKQNMEGVKKMLSLIKNPKACLIKKQQGYYNYLYGIMAVQTNLNESERYLRKALGFGLNMSFDVAMAKLTLAGILMQKRRKLEATTLLSEAKKADKYNMLGDQIKLLQQQLKKI